MSREIRGIRNLTDTNDGDTINISDFKLYRNGRWFEGWRPRQDAVGQAGLKIRLLGIDTPETRYNGSSECPPGSQRLSGSERPRIPAQNPWGNAAKKWLNQNLPDEAQVIVELEDQTYDKNNRVLGYVWTVRGRWEKDKLLNAGLVAAGHAFPYQIYPNLRRFSEIKESAKAAISSNLGVFKALADRILDLDEVAAGDRLNEPFLYRKVVDAAICQVSVKSLLTRPVGDARDWRYYEPTQYTQVPIPYRVFFDTVEQAEDAGFIRE